MSNIKPKYISDANIYYIKTFGPSNEVLIKIGYSSNIVSRLSNYSNHNPFFELVDAIYIEDAKEWESALHSNFKAEHGREWYSAKYTKLFERFISGELDPRDLEMPSKKLKYIMIDMGKDHIYSNPICFIGKDEFPAKLKEYCELLRDGFYEEALDLEYVDWRFRFYLETLGYYQLKRMNFDIDWIENYMRKFAKGKDEVMAILFKRFYVEGKVVSKEQFNRDYAKVLYVMGCIDDVADNKKTTKPHFIKGMEWTKCENGKYIIGFETPIQEVSVRLEDDEYHTFEVPCIKDWSNTFDFYNGNPSSYDYSHGELREMVKEFKAKNGI